MTIDTNHLTASMPWSQDDEEAWASNEGHELDPFFQYADRETYLAWVREWKATYLELSAQIRAAKAERRELQRAGTYDAEAARPLIRHRRLARGLLGLRRAAKRDSWTKRSAARVA